jgi:hypothetical protein
LRDALDSIYHDVSINEITEQELKSYSVIRYGTPDGFYMDVIASLGDAFSFNDLEFEIIEYPGQKIKVATPESLFKLKRDTLREKDRSDAYFLKELITLKN